MMCSSALNSRGKPAVSPMRDSPTFYIEKKQKRGEFKTPPRPMGRQSNNIVAKMVLDSCAKFYLEQN